MELIVRCPRCEGRKRIVALGNMIKKCHECLGVGHIKKEKIEFADTSKSIDPAYVEPKIVAASVVIGPVVDVKIDKRKKKA